MYDITDRESFERMQNWLRELKKLVGAEICIVIAGNKIDQRARQQVPESEAKDFAAANNAKYECATLLRSQAPGFPFSRAVVWLSQAFLHIGEG